MKEPIIIIVVGIAILVIARTTSPPGQPQSAFRCKTCGQIIRGITEQPAANQAK